MCGSQQAQHSRRSTQSGFETEFHRSAISESPDAAIQFGLANVDPSSAKHGNAADS